MDAESFFARWSRRKGQTGQEDEASGQSAAGDQSAGAPGAKQAEGDAPAQPDHQPQPAPTQQDVANLTPESDYSRFLAPGVDDSIKRSALKKLFTDPHYNVMDGLDVYIEDYNKFEPILPEMLAKLKHAKALLDPLSHLRGPLSGLMDKVAEPSVTPEQAEPGEAGAEVTATDADEPVLSEPAPSAATDSDPVAGTDTPAAEPQAEAPAPTKHP